jgi:hypothetical protein
MEIQRRTMEYDREYENINWVHLSVADSHGKLVAAEELEVSLWKLIVWLEDLFTVGLFEFRCYDTTSEDWES